MNKFKLVALSIVATCTMCAHQVKAQDKPLTFGVKIGANLSSLAGDAKEMKSAIRYQIGLTADIALSNQLVLLTALNLQEKGLKNNSKQEDALKLSPVYMQLPIHLAYKLTLAQDLNLLVGAGPYLAYGLGGKTKGTSEKLFDSSMLKRLDYGAGASAALDFGKIGLGAGYDIGLNNISAPKGTKLKNRTAYVTLGYKF